VIRHRGISIGHTRSPKSAPLAVGRPVHCFLFPFIVH
jgi:hypothetical protein